MKKKHLNWLLIGAAVAGGYYLLKKKPAATPATTPPAPTTTTTTSTGAKSTAPSAPQVQAGSLGAGCLGTLGGSIF